MYHYLGASIVLHATALAKEVGVLSRGEELAQKHVWSEIIVNFGQVIAQEMELVKCWEVGEQYLITITPKMILKS